MRPWMPARPSLNDVSGGLADPGMVPFVADNALRGWRPGLLRDRRPADPTRYPSSSAAIAARSSSREETASLW
jgi:hypothetical protein